MEGAWESGATTHWSPGSPQECPRATDWTASDWTASPLTVPSPLPSTNRKFVKGIDLGIIPGVEINQLNDSPLLHCYASQPFNYEPLSCSISYCLHGTYNCRKGRQVRVLSDVLNVQISLCLLLKVLPSPLTL